MGHHKFSPSSFPAFSICPHFSGSKEESPNASYGTKQHEMLECLMNNRHDDFEKLDGDSNQVNNVEWTYGVVQDFINEEMYKRDCTIEVLSERQVATETSDLTFITGTADVIILVKEDEKVVKAILIDAKFGKKRDYTGQMKVYALGVMQEFNLDKVESVIIYGQIRSVESEEIIANDALCYVDEVIGRVKNKHLEDREASAYCSWCEHQNNCKIRLKPLKKMKEIAPTNKKSILRGVNLEKGISELSSDNIGKIIEFSEYVSELKELLEKELLTRLDSGEVVKNWVVKERAGTTTIANQEALKFELKAMRGISDTEIVEKSNLTVTAVKELLYGKNAKKKSEEFKNDFADFLKIGETSRKVCKIKTKKGESNAD